MGKDRKCVCCTKSYTFCPSCNPADKLLPSWYFAYCSESCRTIYNTLTDYDKGSIDAETAKEILEKCDLSRKAYFGPSYIRILGQIDEAVENNKTKVEPDFPYMNVPVEDNSPAIAEEIKEQKATKTVSKIVKKSVASKTGKGDLENS